MERGQRAACFNDLISARKEGTNVLTSDGVHMNAAGNKLMAVGVLEAFGLSASQIKKAEKSWEPLLDVSKESQKARRDKRRTRKDKADE